MRYLKNHPFAVEAFFNRSVVLTFAVLKEELESMIPARFELDTYQDKYAFLAVAMVQSTGLRPKGTPKFIGNDFFLIGYRIFVRYVNKDGRKMRGLYILQSETDKRKMVVLGNLFTNYNYLLTDINSSENLDEIKVYSKTSNFNVVIKKSRSVVDLPVHSPFEDWKIARRFAGPMPYTFSHDVANDSVLIVKGVRQNWNPIPIKVISYQIDFLDTLKLKDILLASAFKIEDVPYQWKKGYIEKWD